MSKKKLYCIDTNILIWSWNDLLSMDMCPDYWDKVDDLSSKGVIFCPEEVKREIIAKDDGLRDWVKSRPYLFRGITEDVQEKLRLIMKSHPILVNNIKQRSVADPWVIAHAMQEGATVVTGEGRTLLGRAKRKKIPDVCDALDVRCINHLQFLKEIGIRFSIPK